MNRAYSILEVKAIDDGSRVFQGIATSVNPDRMGDVMEPKGAEFKLPLALLWQHDTTQPIGHVEKAKVTKTGIEINARIAKMEEPGRLKDRLDEAWQSIRSGLVRGLSIGFRPIESADIKGTQGIHFQKWQWLEVSAVTIPANAEATIIAIKSADQRVRASHGAPSPRKSRRPPAVTGSPVASGRQILIPE